MSRIRHIALRCRDMQATRRFYETAFGWEFLGLRPSGLGLDMTDGTSNVTLIQQPDDCNRPVVPEGDEYIHFGVIVDDLAGCWKRLKDLGAEFSTDAIKQGSESTGDQIPERSFKVLDPDGNVVDVTIDKNEWKGVNLS